MLHSELKSIMKNEAVKELLFITGASPLNPRETWKLNINQTDYENIAKPKVRYDYILIVSNKPH